LIGGAGIRFGRRLADGRAGSISAVSRLGGEEGFGEACDPAPVTGGMSANPSPEDGEVDAEGADLPAAGGLSRGAHSATLECWPYGAERPAPLSRRAEPSSGRLERLGGRKTGICGFAGRTPCTARRQDEA